MIQINQWQSCWVNSTINQESKIALTTEGHCKPVKCVACGKNVKSGSLYLVANFRRDRSKPTQKRGGVSLLLMSHITDLSTHRVLPEELVEAQPWPVLERPLHHVYPEKLLLLHPGL